MRNQMRNMKYMVVALVMAGLTYSPASAEDTITMGVIGPFSGQSAAMGRSALEGIQLGVQQLNEQGGIDGKKVRLIERDSGMRPDLAVIAAKELIEKEGVKVLIGPFSTGEALAVNEVVKESRVLNFNPVAEAAEITGTHGNKYVFQLAPTTDVKGRRVAEVLQERGAKKLCLLGFDYAYTTSLFGHLKSNIEGKIEVTNEYLVRMGATDFSSVITQLMADECDAVFDLIYSSAFISFVNQAQPFGLYETKKIWLNDSAVGTAEMAAALKGSYPEGMWASSPDLYYYSGGGEAYDKYHTALAKFQGREETDSRSITGYMAVQFLAEAIRKAKSTDADALSAALAGLTVETPLGPLTVDATTRRVGAPHFYGPFVSVPGSDVKRMVPMKLVK